MNRFYDLILQKIYKFAGWRIERLSNAINEGDANNLESDDYINKLEDNKEFWLNLNNSLESRLKLQNAD